LDFTGYEKEFQEWIKYFKNEKNESQEGMRFKLITLVGKPYPVSPGPACACVAHHAPALQGTPLPAETCAKRTACAVRASRFRNAFSMVRRFAAVFIQLLAY
jgi:hypothetical protein